VTRQRKNPRAAKLTRRAALAAAAGALALGQAGAAAAADKRAATKPKLTFSVSPAKPVAGQPFTVLVKADATNPKSMGLVVTDLSVKGRKALRQTYFKGTILPGQTASVTFRPTGTDDKKIKIRVLAWDKESPPQKSDDIRNVLFLERKSYTFD
jgi:hypothetical protein